MNFFEDELKRIASVCENIRDPVFAGRACYGDLGKGIYVKMQFTAQDSPDRYDALRATILSRSHGEIDSVLFRFGDVWGKKYDVGTKDGVPHIITALGRSEWQSYYPTRPDMKHLAAQVGAYAGIFADKALTLDYSKELPKPRAAKKPIADRLEAGKQKAASRKPDLSSVAEAPRRPFPVYE